MSSEARSNAKSSKKGEHQTVTELTDQFYKGDEEVESTGHTALQSDSQAIYVSILQGVLCFAYTLTFKISYLGEDVEEIPTSLCREHGGTAKRLDLSYNRLRCAY